MQLFEFIRKKKSNFAIFPSLSFSLKILTSAHFYGTVQFIFHFRVSPWMAADAISVLPFYLNWKCFNVFPSVLSSSLAKKPFTGNDDQMHMLPLCLTGLRDTCVIFLSPSALYSGQTSRESDLIHCQSNIPFPSLAAARREQRGTVPAVPARRHAGAGLYHPVGWQSTRGCDPVPYQLQQVLTALRC